MDIKADFVPWNLLVRKHANQMPRNRTAVLPASLLRQLLGASIQIRPGEIIVFVKIERVGYRAADACAPRTTAGLEFIKNPVNYRVGLFVRVPE
jgi:hypothetical protein